MKPSPMNMQAKELAYGPIRDALAQAGADGLSSREISEQIGVEIRTVRDRCWRYVGKGWIFIHGCSKLARYFGSLSALDEHMRTLDARTARHKQMAADRERARWQARNAMRPKKDPKPHPMAANWALQHPTKRNTITPRKNVEIIVPDHIEVKHCPRSVDYRFSVSPHFVGEFTREWKERRA